MTHENTIALIAAIIYNAEFATAVEHLSGNGPDLADCVNRAHALISLAEQRAMQTAPLVTRRGTSAAA